MRHAPAGSLSHGVADHLSGTGEYGNAADGILGSSSASGWSIRFDGAHFNQFMFTSGDCSKWLVASKEAVVGSHYGYAARDVAMSSSSAGPHQVRWYNREGRQEDPVVSLSDAGTAGNTDVLYAEGGGDGQGVGLPSTGANVYIRFSGELCARRSRLQLGTMCTCHVNQSVVSPNQKHPVFAVGARCCSSTCS